MSLPSQVVRDMEEIAEYEKSLAGPEVEPTEVIEETQEPVPALEVVAEPVVVQEVAPVVEAKPDDEMTWKQRYKTLDGMIEASNRRNTELVSTIKSLQDEVTAMKEVTSRVETQPTQSLVSDEEIENIGADVIDVHRRITREVVTPLQAKLDAIEAENKYLRDMVGKSGDAVASFSFEQEVAAKIPDFKAINADPRWVGWLDEVDPMLRGPRRNAAQAAYAAGDVVAVADYVKMFKDSVATSTVSQADTELKSQVAPSRSATSAAPANNQPRTYTEAEAGQLFDKVGMLYRQGKNEEGAKLEAELSDAFVSGRIR